MEITKNDILGVLDSISKLFNSLVESIKLILDKIRLTFESKRFSKCIIILRYKLLRHKMLSNKLKIKYYTIKTNYKIRTLIKHIKKER